VNQEKIMSVTSTGNASLDKIASSYHSNEKEKADKEDALGRDAFLTMLVAELKYQDPLNPMDGSDFSAQLAQFSQLEQLINLNDSMTSFTKSFTDKSGGDALDYIGRQVSGVVDTMSVEDGKISGGFYNLDAPADIMISITDSNGKNIRTIYAGQQDKGSHTISWDGKDKDGRKVDNGSYKYIVMANTGHGFVQVPSVVTGKVDGVSYHNDKPYLLVNGALLDPDSLKAVMNSQSGSNAQSTESALTYLGRTISSNAPVVLVEDGAVSGSDLQFHLDKREDVSVTIYDSSNNPVRTINISAENTKGGDNEIQWDGVSDSGYSVPDGLYYYTVKTSAGLAETPVQGTVSGIRNINGNQYLVMKNNGRLVPLSSITQIN
jgi:flagellar basal-body rod modification protein FlgD